MLSKSEGGIIIQDLAIICGLSNAEECCELENSLVCTLGDDSSDDVIPLNPPVTSSLTKNYNFNKSGHKNFNKELAILKGLIVSFLHPLLSLVQILVNQVKLPPLANQEPAEEGTNQKLSLILILFLEAIP